MVLRKGAYGFLGRYFVHELGSCGTRTYVPFRGCEMEVRHLKPSFDLGQVTHIYIHTHTNTYIHSTYIHITSTAHTAGPASFQPERREVHRGLSEAQRYSRELHRQTLRDQARRAHAPQQWKAVQGQLRFRRGSGWMDK